MFEETMEIKNWYMENYPQDDLGVKLNESNTFDDLFYTLDRGLDVYEFLGVGDSIIRERIFEKLAEIMGVDYNYIYTQWLNS